MRPQRAGARAVSTGKREDGGFGGSLRVGVMRGITFHPVEVWGNAFIDAALVVTGERDARATRVHKPRYPMDAAPGKNILRAFNINALIVGECSADACEAGGMEDTVDAFASRSDGALIADVAAD